MLFKVRLRTDAHRSRDDDSAVDGFVLNEEAPPPPSLTVACIAKDSEGKSLVSPLCVCLHFIFQTVKLLLQLFPGKKKWSTVTENGFHPN